MCGAEIRWIKIFSSSFPCSSAQQVSNTLQTFTEKIWLTFHKMYESFVRSFVIITYNFIFVRSFVPSYIRNIQVSRTAPGNYENLNEKKTNAIKEIAEETITTSHKTQKYDMQMFPTFTVPVYVYIVDLILRPNKKKFKK